MTHIGTVPLETRRLRLRRLEESDGESIFAMFSDERVTRFLWVTTMFTISQAEDMVKSMISAYEKSDTYRWVLEEKDTGRFVGIINMHSLSERDEVGELGYCALHSMWGNGYMAEAIREVLGFAFFKVGYNRIEAGHAVQNPASGAVMRKAGMLYEGMAREKYKNYHGYHDTHQYGILKKDY